MVPWLALLFSVVVAQFPVNDTGVSLPPGCKQVLWYRGSGTQDYICSDPTNTGKLAWTLVEPHAILQSYSSTAVNQSINGFHYFTKPGVDGQAGSGPGWSLGSACGWYNCTSVTDQFLGAVNTSAPQPGTIPWLLISKISSYGPLFQSISYVQRLATVGGLAPYDCSYLGQTYNAAYQADYLFATCSSAPESTTHPQFDPNNPHHKYQSTFLKKNQQDTTTPSPSPSSTHSLFNPNNPHNRYTEDFYNKYMNPTNPSETTPTHPTATTRPHNRYDRYYQEEFYRRQHVHTSTSAPTSTTLPTPTTSNQHDSDVKEFLRKCHEPTPPPITPPPTDTPNIYTYEKYTRYRKVFPTPDTNEVSPTNQQTQQTQSGQEQLSFHSPPSHHQENGYFPIRNQQEVLTTSQSQKLTTDPTPLPIEENYNPHETHSYRPRTRHYRTDEQVTSTTGQSTQFTDDPTPLPIEVNYNPHETHAYRPRTRHYEQTSKVEQIGNPKPENTLSNDPTPLPVEVNYNPRETHSYRPRTRHYETSSPNTEIPRVDIPEINRPPSDFGVGIEENVGETAKVIPSTTSSFKDAKNPQVLLSHLRRGEVQ